MTVLLGAHAIPQGTQFAVLARDAASVELCLLEDHAERRLPMQRQGDIFVAVAKVEAGQRYGFRASGKWAPGKGLFFDPTKLLADPYATRLDGRWGHDEKLAQYGIDTASLVPKAMVEAPFAPVPVQPPIFQPGRLIYELNVRAFTLCHPEVPPAIRGTIAALAHPAIIEHFRKLHVGAIELMPIVAWIDERHLPPLGLRNAWGYNPVTPMAIDPGLAPGGIGELRATIATLRESGIGVILDLVLNHTGESDLAGPILSLRGLDNRCYARGPDGALINDTGTGNTLDFSDAATRDLALETLRHFARAGVDGFRLDLATILARGPTFDPAAPIFDAIMRDPVLQGRVFIAEPWDVGPGGYQLGRFPANWLEWNDRYRDDVRRFWRGDANATASLATRLTGSSDIFSGNRTRSVNFIAAHDGFTLADLVAFEHKHNEANGENDRDGRDENFSWNNGKEGSTDDDIIARCRQADIRALLATLFASRGTIQITAGDEFGRTQNGNNNAYAQDNSTTWINWLDRDQALEAFAQSCARTRANTPLLEEVTFLDDADWFDLAGAHMTTEKWEDAGLDGFEVHIQDTHGGIVAIRIDRQARRCEVRCVQPEAAGQ